MPPRKSEPSDPVLADEVSPQALADVPTDFPGEPVPEPMAEPQSVPVPPDGGSYRLEAGKLVQLEGPTMDPRDLYRAAMMEV